MDTIDARSMHLDDSADSALALPMLEVGRAAEHLVVADLILQGIPAFLTDQGLPFDVVADFEGRLIRIQVKGTLRPTNGNATGKAPRMAYIFRVRRCGKGGRQTISAKHCDMVALVALDLRQVAYLSLSQCRETVTLDAPGGRIARVGRGGPRAVFGRCINQYPFREAMKNV